MKHLVILLAILLLMTGSAVAETIGFGYVNASDVALRREPGGGILVRVPQDTCVWVSGSRTDQKGRLWYQVNTGLNLDHANYDYYGWMMADFIDCGDTVWHDVVSISCSTDSKGMMAVFRDGSALTAIRPIVSEDGKRWVNARRMTAKYEPVRQGLVNSGLNFYALDSAGILHWDFGESDVQDRFRLIGGDDLLIGITTDNRLSSTRAINLSELQWVIPAQRPSEEMLSHVQRISFDGQWLLLVTDTGELLAASHWRSDDYPDWTTWQGITSIDAGVYCETTWQSVMGNVYTAVKENGTALVHPAFLQEKMNALTDLKDIQVGRNYLLVLKKDGTALTISINGQEAPDVSAWEDVDAIEASITYCVGLKKDGTLVFAGDMIFMDEGHVRR